MEGKERYELNDNDYIIDNEKDVAICDICDVSESPKILVNLLNQQNKHIKELEEENQQLKQSQKQFAIEELEKLKDTMFKEAHLSEEITFVEWLYDNYLDNQIKELGGEKNE